VRNTTKTVQKLWHAFTLKKYNRYRYPVTTRNQTTHENFEAARRCANWHNTKRCSAAVAVACVTLLLAALGHCPSRVQALLRWHLLMEEAAVRQILQ
jgi:hypothetical protein